MDVYEAVSKRRSVREFEDRPVPEHSLKRLMDALIMAPSAGNLQSRKFYLTTDPTLRRALAAAAMGQSHVALAPAVFVCCADGAIHARYGDRGINLYSIQDVAASIMCMMLVAVEEGLGTVWVGAFREAEAVKALRIPDALRPVAMVPVGYPARLPTPRVSADQAVIRI